MTRMEKIYQIGLGLVLALAAFVALLGLTVALAPPERQQVTTIQSQAATRFTDMTIDNDLTVGGEVTAGTLDCTTASFDDFAGDTITASVVFVGDLAGKVNDAYPLLYDAAGYAIDIGTDTVTTTLALSLSNVTTPTIGLCTLAEDVDGDEAICSISISGTDATLKLWDAAGTSAGSVGTEVHWLIIGEE